MRRAVLILACVATACTARSVTPLPDGLWVSVHDGSGRRIAGFAVAKDRYVRGMEPRVGGNLTVDARDRKGRVINAWGLYGFPQANKARVLFLAQVEVPAVERPRSGDAPIFRWEEVGAYLLAPGESHAIVESSGLGLGSMTIQLGKTPGS
jgi:hypothetical protein